jgi:hypothetical protein
MVEGQGSEYSLWSKVLGHGSQVKNKPRLQTILVALTLNSDFLTTNNIL